MSQPRSVKIGDNERGGWSSDRPRKPGEAERPPRQQDVSVRGRVLSPVFRMRYNPGSLLVIACADPAVRAAFVARVIEEQSTVFSLEKVKGLLAGKVAADEIDAKAQTLLDAAVAKRFAAGASVVVPLEGLGAEERERYVRLAAPHRRARHLILVEAGKDSVAEEDRAPLTDLRNRLDAGELGQEGFQTAMRMSAGALKEIKAILFRPAPQED